MSTLHIGGNVVLSKREITGIFSGIAENSGFLGAKKEALAVRNVSDRDRSFITVMRKKKVFVYYSKITAKKLIKRSTGFKEEKNGKETG